MNSTSFQARRKLQHVELTAEPPSYSKTRRGSRLLAALARIATYGDDHDEAMFFRIEYGKRAWAAQYTTAREEQLRSELLGPPPLGL
ncbi:MAG: hypothetical protein WD894_25980 [Pirellulales bacterium]